MYLLSSDITYSRWKLNEENIFIFEYDFKELSYA